MKKQDDNEAARYFESISTDTNEGIVVVDHEGIILKVNPIFAEILGYQEHEMLGKHFHSIILCKKFPPQPIISLYPLHQFYIAEKTSIGLTFFNKQGREVPVRFRSVIMRDEHGQVKQAIGRVEQLHKMTGTDEGGVNNHAEKMWEIQQNFENVFNNSADGIVICDSSGLITMANKAFSQMIDYTQEELKERHIAEFTAYVEGTHATTTGEEVIIDEEFVTFNASRIGELNVKGYISNWETYFVKKNKVHVPVEATISVLKDKDDERRGTVVILRDITKRRKTDDELMKHRKQLEGSVDNLQEAKDYLENIFEGSADSIIVLDLSQDQKRLVIRRVNSAFEHLFGYKKEEIFGQGLDTLISPDNHEAKEKMVIFQANFLNKGETSPVALDMIAKNGNEISVEVSGALIKNNQKNTIGAELIFRDLRQRRKLEVMKNEFLFNISHELRTPLASIKGSLDNLLDGIAGELNDSQEEYLEIINNESDRLVRLINDLLDLNKLEVDAIKIIPQKIEYISIVEQVIQSLKDLADNKGLLLSIETHSPEIYLKADSDRVNQILVNLICNGINFTQQGEINVVIEDDDSQVVVTRIQDTGIGIPPDELGKVFDKFYQLKRKADEKNRGTGLGLAITKRFVELHGGSIWVKSSEGKGSEFCFSLPKGGC
jgi:PAS domain S-box-containing protein